MLTTAQLQTLKAAILAETNPTFVGYRNAGETGLMANWLNELSTFVVWRTSVTQDECQQVAGFDWAQIDNLTVGQARIWDWMFKTGVIDASRERIRAGINECWKGTAAKLAVGTAVLAVCKRNATRGEAILASGTGTSASPGTMSFEGDLTSRDVIDALAV